MRARIRGRHDRGASAVEMALVLPVLLLVLGGIIDFGRLFATQMTLTQASREGARMKALRYTDGQMTTRVQTAANGITVTATTVTSCPTAPQPTDAAVVRVSSTFNYVVLDGLFNLFGGGLSPTQTLSSTGSMRCDG